MGCLFFLLFSAVSVMEKINLECFMDFTQTPPPPPPLLLTWCPYVKLNTKSCYSSSHCDKQKYFILPCHAFKDFFFKINLPSSTFKNSVQRKNACIFIWRTKSEYSDHLILLFAHIVFHVCGQLQLLFYNRSYKQNNFNLKGQWFCQMTMPVFLHILANLIKKISFFWYSLHAVLF